MWHYELKEYNMQAFYIISANYSPQNSSSTADSLVHVYRIHGKTVAFKELLEPEFKSI